MGKACCSNKDVEDKDTNLSRRKRSGKKNTVNEDFGKKLPLATVIKFQAIIRGFLTRRQVRNTYGFTMTPGMLNRNKLHIEMDPE